MSRFASVLSLSLLALVGVGCSEPAAEAPAEAPAVRVENSQLGVALANVPSFFRVASNENGTIVLEPAAAETDGTLTVMATEPDVGGVNLVAAVEEHEADILGRDGGDYKGQRELNSQLGPAFYSRGLWNDGATRMEETSVFVVHPAGDRQLVLHYVYPAGDDSSARLMDQLFEVLGEVEAIPMAAPADGGDAEAMDGSAMDETADSAG